MGPARRVGEAFFPLDEQLALTSAGVTPRAEETLVRLASWMPFEAAQELLHDLVGVQVSTATARRATLASGEAALAGCEQEEERLKQEAPTAPEGADKQAMSGDGAFVHLVGGEWVEVKSLTLATVTCNVHGEVCLEQISSFSRLWEAERFTEAALVETHRRGLERATEVCAVQDGALWLQGLVDYHRADAVRILDFPHAAEYINAIGQAVQAAGGRLPTKWLEGVLHRLKHQGPERVLKHLAWLAAHYPSSGIQEPLAYLQKRAAHMQYPIYQAAGWPIGSGSVESANKVVVEARLKGAGMRWQDQNVNRMLVLRNGVCNRRWKETWPAARAQRQGQRLKLRQAASQRRLSEACWTLAFWSVRLARLSHRPAPAAPVPPVPGSRQPPARRLGTTYSWHQPFLRRPPAAAVRTEEVAAKK
jgi:hypothetical protein